MELKLDQVLEPSEERLHHRASDCLAHDGFVIFALDFELAQAYNVD
jgi:hypothetical protein